MTKTIKLSFQGNNSLYIFFISIFPVISMYRIPVLGISLASFLFILLGIIALIKTLPTTRSHLFFLLCFWLFYYLWIIVKSGTLNRVISFFILIHLFRLMNKGDRFKTFRRTVETISLFAFFLVVLQYIGKYLLGIHIPMVITQLCTEDVRLVYSGLIKTGYSTVSGMYRPSAFFLEPSHYSEYCIFGLLSCFCNENSKHNVRKSILISAGIILTTSGMGIVLCVALWMWKYLIGNSNKTFTKRFLQAFGILVILVLLYFILIQIPIFEKAIGRIVGSNNSLGALKGRTMMWGTLFEGKGIMNLLWGNGELFLPQEYYLTGLMKIIFAYGIIGLLLLLFAVLKLISCTNRFGKMVCLLYLAFLPISDQIGFIGTLFMIGMAMCSVVDDRHEQNGHCILWY